MRLHPKLLPFLMLYTILLVIQISIPVRGFPENNRLSSPPTPAFKLTVPRINEITYVITLTNPSNSSLNVTLNIALPKTWSPDTFIQLKEVKLTSGVIKYHTNRENNYLNVAANLGPKESLQVNITFHSLKFKVDFYTHNLVQNLSYPNSLIKYTKPEKYIESDEPLIVNKAEALAGDRKNPIHIAERMYDFVRSYLTYEKQSEIRGASWAFLNGRGDCTEYGTLFVALLRAVGIPSRIVMGHASQELSQGGVANATELWVDSPHLWTEFYVEGFGWIPVDPTFGINDPLDHFGVSWSYYLPIIKGPTMESPYRSLITYKPASLKHDAYIIVKPLEDVSKMNRTIIKFLKANQFTNELRLTADISYKKGFNITEAYPLIEQTYNLLYKTATELEKRSKTAEEYAEDTYQNALKTLEVISEIALREAEKAVSTSWRSWKFLGALSGEIYLEKARVSASRGDFQGIIKNSYYAISTVDKAPNIFIFICPILLSILTVWVVSESNYRK